MAISTSIRRAQPRENAITSASVAVALGISAATVLACTGVPSFPYLEHRPARSDRHSSFHALDVAAHRSAPRRRSPASTTPEASDPRGPISLTASDGTGLALTKLHARAVVHGPLAFTELRLTFRNPTDRTLEGRFEITLPDTASVSRFAMRIGYRWQEGEVVERQHARQAYEAFLHRNVDPALLEKKAGNAFRARVFPIRGRTDKHLILSYSHELPTADTPYILPLAGLPRIDELDIELSGVTGGRLVERAYRPERDFVLPVPKGAAGVRHGELAVARVPVGGLVPQSDGDLGDLVVLVDTSASQAATLTAQVAALDRLVRAMAEREPAGMRVRIACYDQTLEPIYEGPVRGFGRQQRERILARRALGASDLHRALDWVGQADGYRRVLLIGDGIATAGDSQVASWRAQVAAWPASIERVDALAFGRQRDRATLRALVVGNRARAGVVLDGSGTAADWLARLRQTAVAEQHVAADLPWLWPTSLAGGQAGETRLVYMQLPADQRGPVRLTLSEPSVTGDARTRVVEVSLEEAPGPLVRRSWAGARIRAKSAERARVPATDSEARERLRAEIVQLSTEHRVLSEHTALVVLETESDYRRFCIDRNALSDIMTIENGTLLQKTRTRARSRKGARTEPSTEQPCRPGEEPERDESARANWNPEDSGAISGVIRDRDSGEPLVGATVVVRVPGDAAHRAVITDENGWFFVGNLAAGAYDVTVYFLDTESRRTNVVVRVGQEIRFGSGRTRRRPGRGRRSRSGSLAGAPGRSVGSAGAPLPAGASAVQAGDLSLDTSASSGELLLLLGNTPMIDQGTTQLGLVHRQSDWLLDPPPVYRPPPLRPAYTGELLRVMELLRTGRRTRALAAALRWRDREPTSLMALVALGEALEARGSLVLAARVYGSIIDLHPSRAEMRRFAGERLERLGQTAARLVVDTYARALALRPDILPGYRLLAYAYLRVGRFERAFETLAEGWTSFFPRGRFFRGRAISRDDLGLLAAVWAARQPERGPHIHKRLRELGVRMADRPSLHILLHWETDANDVDLHVHDGDGGRATGVQRHLASGGALYGNVTNGYGPEGFVVRTPPRGFPYRIRAHYYRRGPMGYGMGKVQILAHDGRGGLVVLDRPFVVMNDNAHVELGRLTPADVAMPTGAAPAR